MTPEEFAAEHGLSVEEATLILSRRQAARAEAEAGGRVGLAKTILSQAQKKVGVHPVKVAGDSVEKRYDPDADVGLSRFYKKGNFRNPENGAWDEFDQSGGDE